MSTIKIYTKNVYGRELIYMKDEEMTQAVQRLTGRKTLQREDIDALKKLGVEFVHVVEREVA